MKNIRVHLKERSYPIIIGNNSSLGIGALCRKLNIGKDAIIITNSLLKKKFLPKITSSLKQNNFSIKTLLVPDSEKAKSSHYCLSLIEKISRYDKKKQPFIIALGGGVIGDLAGFVASIYKRGIPIVQVPTTFLGQIDSAIGGKTAIDLAIAKNLVGAFYQPKAVIVDLNFLKTLPQRQIRTGLAEVIKYGIIKDKKLFYFLKNNYKKILKLNPQAVNFIVTRCVKIKARIIEVDEREKKGIRTILNFGHTVGHAIESACGYNKFTHGEAISVGMLCASEIAANLNMLKKKDQNQIQKLIELYKLPTTIRKTLINKIMNSLLRDKKFIKSKPRFVLPVSIGKVIVKSDISVQLIRGAIKKYSY